MPRETFLEYPEGTRFTTIPPEADDYDKPSFVSPAYTRMQPLWTLCDDVYTGTLRIREKAKQYLPQFPIESGDAWTSRTAVAVLMNVYARTVDAMVGLVIGSGLKTKGVPKSIESHLKNIDNAGTQFEVFARDVLRDAFQGHCVVLIDMPSVPEEDRPRNRTEQKKSKLRPYWTRRRPEEIINWRTEVIDGETVIKLITFRECVSIPVGEFGETEEIRYLVWYLTKDDAGKTVSAFRKYREVEEKTKNKEGKETVLTAYELVDSGITHLDRIPMFVVYGDRSDGKILESRPPLVDLAHKNVEHLQIDSDYKKGLGIAGLAIPVLKTDRGEEEIDKIFGWDIIMVLDKDGEDFSFVEANGQALPNKRTALEDIKREMGVLGLSLIAERADANITATERVLDSVQQSNQLMAIQASLLQGLAIGLEIHGKWMKLSETEMKDMAVELGLDWTELVRSADHMQLILEMAKEDFISTLTLLESAGKYGVLPSYINADEEVARLQKEGRVRQSRMTMKATSGGVTVDGKGKKSKQLDKEGPAEESGTSNVGMSDDDL
jgi:hypothetical protein